MNTPTMTNLSNCLRARNKQAPKVGNALLVTTCALVATFCLNIAIILHHVNNDVGQGSAHMRLRRQQTDSFTKNIHPTAVTGTLSNDESSSNYKKMIMSREEPQSEISITSKTGAFANCSNHIKTVGSNHPDQNYITLSCHSLPYRMPKILFMEDIFIGALSAAGGDGPTRRKSIRETWGLGHSVFFIVAGPWDVIQDEYAKHKDLIWLDQEEIYDGEKSVLTFKTMTFIQIASQNPSIKYAFKTDDDSFVNVKFLHKHLLETDREKQFDFWGKCNNDFNIKPSRDPNYKWSLSHESYPEEYFPQYCQGAGFALSRKFLDCAGGPKNHIAEMRYMPFEDVAVGLLAERCGVVPDSAKGKELQHYRTPLKMEHDHVKYGMAKIPKMFLTIPHMEGTIVQHRIQNEWDMMEHYKQLNDPKNYRKMTDFKWYQPKHAEIYMWEEDIENNPNAKKKEKSKPNLLKKNEYKHQRLEFVHITKTGGSAVESAGAQHGVLWGARHYTSVEEVQFSTPDIKYTPPHFQSYSLISPWHTPPKYFGKYVDVTAIQPFFKDADLFTIVRNPYDRIVSEYYCPWTGFKADFKSGIDPNDPINLNLWVKDFIKQKSIAVKELQHVNQLKQSNEDKFILSQKHYINQVEYIFHDNGEILIKNVLNYENLPQEFEALMKMYDMGEIHLPPKEKGGIYTDTSKKRLTYKDLDAGSILAINEYAKHDFEKLGYVMVEKEFSADYSLNI